MTVEETEGNVGAEERPSPEPVSPGGSSAFDSDDDFGEFDAFEAEPSAEPSVKDDTPVDAEAIVETQAEKVDANAPKLVKSSDISGLSVEEIRGVLTAPPPVGETVEAEIANLEDGTTPTSQALWQHLTEPTWMPLPKWEGSPIHRQLVVHLGIPLDLDVSLPKSDAARGALALPIHNSHEGVEGLQNIPSWWLSMASEEALNVMDVAELQAHVAKLQLILDESHTLKDAMESREMDLIGEKNILEGMVESLLLFSQRKQRERLKKKASKS